MLRRDALIFPLAAAAFHFARPALAQPVESARFFYGFPAGSSGDIVARRVAERLPGSPYLRGGAIVENRTGAGGRIALEALKGAPADGSTLALTPYSCTAVYPHIYSKLAYDPQADLTPVTIAAVMLQGFAVGPLVDERVKTLRDFIAWAKANPQVANYGSPGAGTVPHFVGALFSLAAGIDMKHVPYRGSLPGVSDVAGGQIAAMSTPHGDFFPHYRSGRLRVLATSGAQRSPFLPEVPTFAEQGFPDVVADEWFGFFAPARTPAPVVAAASSAINAALRDRAVVDSLAGVGLIARGTMPDEMAASQRAEFSRWRSLVKRVGFTAES